MEESFARIQIEDEEEGGLVYKEPMDNLSEIDACWCLVGRFLTESPIDFQAMHHKMASLWKPGRGVYVKELEPNRYIFQFYHEIDIKRVTEEARGCLNDSSFYLKDYMKVLIQEKF